MCVVPVPGKIVRHFDPPVCERCAGHRGVTLQTASGVNMVASASGLVEFVGTVGERLYVVQRVSPTVRVTYGDLASAEVEKGATVSAGDTLGVSGESTYLSVRVGDKHVEPLRALGLGRPRLVPSGAPSGLWG